MATQGQRFRRRALRRGYKVDEVDAFLERVEATLEGAPIGEPVLAQDVHDVVFRVRFGGYDEWQVDVYLDRLERQLAALEQEGRLGLPAGQPPEQRAGREREAYPQPREETGYAPEEDYGPEPTTYVREPDYEDYGPEDRQYPPEPEYDRGYGPEREQPVYGRSRPEDTIYGRGREERAPLPPAAAPPAAAAGR